MARHYTKHGLAKLEGTIKRRTRRGRSLVDRRTKAGKDAMKLRDDLIRDQGGLEKLSTAQLLIIELLTRDCYLLNEQDVRIFRTLKESPQAQSSPKVVATMYGYRRPIAESVRENVKILGVKIPPTADKDTGTKYWPRMMTNGGRRKDEMQFEIVDAKRRLLLGFALYVLTANVNATPIEVSNHSRRRSLCKRLEAATSTKT